MDKANPNTEKGSVSGAQRPDPHEFSDWDVADERPVHATGATATTASTLTSMA
jgi:hypothetical protein